MNQQTATAASDDVPLLLENEAGEIMDLQALLVEEGSLPFSKQSCTHAPTPSFSFRPLQPSDRRAIQSLHEEWFPVKYEDEFYDELVKNRMFQSGAPLFSSVAVAKHQTTIIASSDNKTVNISTNNINSDNEEIAACVVGSFLEASRVHKETRQALVPNPHRHSRLFYIMTLGTVTKYRHLRLGSTMVKQCIQQVEQDPQCGALYLHVITFNKAAIRFYEKLGFSRVMELKDYYTIDGEKYNCYLYAKYFHGNRGHKKGIFHFVSHVLWVVWDRVLSPVTLLQEIVGVAGLESSGRREC